MKEMSERVADECACYALFGFTNAIDWREVGAKNMIGAKNRT